MPRLDADSARSRFASARAARLATVGADGRPHLVVITFAVDGDRVYTAVDHKPKVSRNLKRLRNIVENPRVAVLADHYEDDWDKLWWARADGSAEILEGFADMAAPLRLLAAHYRQYRSAPPEGPVIAITVRRWTGWRAQTPGTIQ